MDLVDVARLGIELSSNELHSTAVAHRSSQDIRLVLQEVTLTKATVSFSFVSAGND